MFLGLGITRFQGKFSMRLALKQSTLPILESPIVGYHSFQEIFNTRRGVVFFRCAG